MSKKLNDKQLTILWSRFDVPAWAEWHDDYLAIVTWARDLPDTELRSEAAQRRLWNARVVHRVLNGEGYEDKEELRVEELLADPDVVESIAALRDRSWPAGTTQRAEAIEAEVDHLVELSIPYGLERAPAGPLQRVLCVLLPAETCVGGNRRNTKRLLLGGIGRAADLCQVLMRGRLRDVLGKEKDLSEHIRRSTFCWWLFENYERLAAGRMPPWSEDEPLTVVKQSDR